MHESPIYKNYVFWLAALGMVLLFALVMKDKLALTPEVLNMIFAFLGALGGFQFGKRTGFTVQIKEPQVVTQPKSDTPAEPVVDSNQGKDSITSDQPIVSSNPN